MTYRLIMANFKPSPCTFGTLLFNILYTLLNTFQLAMITILSLYMFDPALIALSKYIMDNLYLYIDQMLTRSKNMSKTVSISLQWRMYYLSMYKYVNIFIIMMNEATADIIMFITIFGLAIPVLCITIDCLDTEIHTQTVNDHDKCLYCAKITFTWSKNILLWLKNIFNHGFNAPPLTFLVFIVIFLGDLDSTSGTSKSKQTHVVIVHMTTHFWKATKLQFLGVISKFLHGQLGKEPYFHNITFGAIFGSYFNTKTATAKNLHFFVNKSDRMARLFRTLSRTARFIQKHAKAIGVIYKSISMIKQTKQQPIQRHGYL